MKSYRPRAGIGSWRSETSSAAKASANAERTRNGRGHADGSRAARWSATSPPSLSQEATLRETVLPSVAPEDCEAPARDNTAGSMAQSLEP